MTCLVLAQKEREARIRRLVDTNIIGAVITELDGPIVEANDAFLEMPGYSRDDLVAGRLEWTAPTPAEWHAAAQRAIAQIRATGQRSSAAQRLVAAPTERCNARPRRASKKT